MQSNYPLESLTSASEHVAAARALKKADALACGIDDVFISTLVESFYESVQGDDRLGPIFAKRIQDWPLHLARMKNFWASIMIESGRFNGSPMQKHIAVGGLDAGHFAHWQTLWDQTVTRLAPTPVAHDRFRQAALRIGDSLLTAIELDRGGLAVVSTRKAT